MSGVNVKPACGDGVKCPRHFASDASPSAESPCGWSTAEEVTSIFIKLRAYATELRAMPTKKAWHADVATDLETAPALVMQLIMREQDAALMVCGHPAMFSDEEVDAGECQVCWLGEALKYQRERAEKAEKLAAAWERVHRASDAYTRRDAWAALKEAGGPDLYEEAVSDP